MNAGARRTLEVVAAMGYRRVELAGFGDLPTPEAVREAVEAAGLEMVATHVPIEFLRRDLGAVIRDTLALGTRRVVCPILPAASFADEAACAASGKELAGIAKEMGEAGLKFSYHVHGRAEFVELGGKFALHRMLDECPGVELEIDVLWVAHAGLSPADYIRQWGRRGSLLHIKDMAPDGTSTDLGRGTLDLAGILAAAIETRTADGLIIEQEHFTRPPMQAAEVNLRVLTDLCARARLHPGIRV